MQRRAFITLLVGGVVAAGPLATSAQQRIRRVAVLMGTGDDLQGQSWIKALRQKLQELGWTDGRNAQIEVVWGGADIEQIRASAAKLVNSNPDVILPYTVRVLNAVRQQTTEIPVVFIATNDPVGLGIVKSSRIPTAILPGSCFMKSRWRASW